MTLTVLEATKQSSFEHFKLIAGHRGLDREILKVGILDWEFEAIVKGELLDSDFIRGEFVLSNLMYAKDHPEYILGLMVHLVQSGVSGLGVKDVYYRELPPDALRYADEHSFPVFIFHTTYVEDIITQINERVKAINDYEALENKVDLLVKMHLNKAVVREVAMELNSSFRETFFVLYFKEKRFVSEERLIAAIEGIKKSKIFGATDSVLKYRSGILLILTFDMLEPEAYRKKVSYFLQAVGLPRGEYTAGVGNLHAGSRTGLSELGLGVSESLFAERTAEVTGQPLCHFRETGIYGVLLPTQGDVWLHNFYAGIIGPLRQHDEKFNTELLETAIAFVEQDGNVQKTADALFVHKNTIRYRINKIKELLGMEELELGFLEQLSAAVKLHKIYHL